MSVDGRERQLHDCEIQVSIYIIQKRDKQNWVYTNYDVTKLQGLASDSALHFKVQGKLPKNLAVMKPLINLVFCLLLL